MTYSGGNVSSRNGRTWRYHASASRLAEDAASRSDAGLIGNSASTVSTVCNSALHSRRNFSPRLRPKARMTACAPVLRRTSSALGGGRFAALFMSGFTHKDVATQHYREMNALVYRRNLGAQTGRNFNGIDGREQPLRLHASRGRAPHQNYRGEATCWAPLHNVRAPKASLAHDWPGALP